jgi:hypothetical protein
MIRKPFALGLCFGVVIGAFAAVYAVLLAGNLSMRQYLGAPTSGALPGPIIAAPQISLPDSPQCAPRGIPFEFNGETYYLKPLGAGQSNFVGLGFTLPSRLCARRPATELSFAQYQDEILPCARSSHNPARGS